MWTEAIESERSSLQETQNLGIRFRNRAKIVLSSRWIFCKINVSGSQACQIATRQTRLWKCSFQQKYGADYDETPDPVVKFSPVRLLSVLFALEDPEHYQMRVKTASLIESLTRRFLWNR